MLFDLIVNDETKLQQLKPPVASKGNLRRGKWVSKKSGKAQIF
jgi:hypothetical protein